LPKISVIIPVYNTEKYLRQCLDSIINQTFTDFECICVNDNSNDSSLNILKEYANNDNRIKILYQQNKGPASARNLGIKESYGDYLIFIDSDDWIEKYCLEKFYNIIDKDNYDVVQSNYKIYFQQDNRYESKILLKGEQIKQEDSVFNLLHKTYEGPVWRRIYKKDVIVRNNLYFYEGRTSEDGVFSAILFLHTRKIFYIEDELYIYRKQLPFSASSDLNKLFEDWFYNFYELIKDISKRNLLSNDIINWCIYIFCWDFSRIKKNQSYIKQKELLVVGISILEYLSKHSKSITNIFKAQVLLFILKVFKMKSYKIIRILKNMV